MKKARKILSIVLPVMVIAMFMFVAIGPVAIADGVDSSFPKGNSEGIGTVNTLVNNVWGTVLLVAQILSFAAIVFAGVRYMFASADQKADIKKGLIYLVIGAILVFTASTVVSIIIKATEAAASGV